MADLADDAGAFVAEDGGEQALGIQAVQGVSVGVADPRGLDLDQHLVGARAFQVQFDDLKRAFGLEGDGGAGFHGGVLPRPFLSA